MSRKPTHFFFVPCICTTNQLQWRRTLVLFVLYSTIALGSMLLLFSCNNQSHQNRTIERSFYFWKSNFKLTDFEKKRLDTLHTKTIYLKFFDVDWDEAAGKPLPLAQIKISDSEYLKTNAINIIPTVFITNESLQKIDSTQASTLGENIIGLIKEIIHKNHFNNIPEVQIDCDWTANTKEKYFAILNTIKRLKPNATLSATIRLHQIKYIAKSGIPPVDKGLLMCYNMGNLKNPATKNSILETAELKKYIGSLENYPLQLDVALPLFDWFVLLRDNQYKGLIEHLPTNNTAIEEMNKTTYFLLKDTIINGIEFKKNDILRSEKSNYNEILDAGAAVNAKLKTAHLNLALFHLDSLTLSKYSTYELENIYNSLR